MQPENSTNTGSCKHCGLEIFWHRSKAGKPYPCDSATDRRAFHVCKAPDAFKPSLAEQVRELREQLAKLAGRVGQLEAKERGDVF